MTRVLVTGGSGFIGGHLSAALAHAGDEVHATSRQRQQKTGAAIHWWKTDLSDADSVARVFEFVEPEIVYHLAGFVSGSRRLDTVLPSLRDNLVASVNVLVECARTHARVISAGSMEEQGFDEVPASPYGAAKMVLEHMHECSTTFTGSPSQHCASSWCMGLHNMIVRKSFHTSSPHS